MKAMGKTLGGERPERIVSWMLRGDRETGWKIRGGTLLAWAAIAAASGGGIGFGLYESDHPERSAKPGTLAVGAYMGVDGKTYSCVIPAGRDLTYRLLPELQQGDGEPLAEATNTSAGTITFPEIDLDDGAAQLTSTAPADEVGSIPCVDTPAISDEEKPPFGQLVEVDYSVDGNGSTQLIGYRNIPNN
jgi:hypothetical protein